MSERVEAALSERQYEGENGQSLTEEEARAIRSLQRLAKRWPQSLQLFSASGSLIVLHAGHDADPLPQDAALAHIEGIPNDGGDPW